ncbi:MAG: DNA-3-methyladenine glycosylase I [Anaerolineales bacterium]|jgi:DNA-3-methyladenine glycosylase I
MNPIRCDWSTRDPLMINYHDVEWGVPVHDDQILFEHLSLDTFQAGLSWQTILRKRENFRKAFDHFNIERVAQYDQKKISELLKNEGIIRNRQKIEATIHNACRVIEIQVEYGSFNYFVWSFTDGRTIHNTFRKMSELPATSDISDAMSLSLRGKGFKFIGSTICYAFMQAIGVVNDHLMNCFRYNELH